MDRRFQRFLTAAGALLAFGAAASGNARAQELAPRPTASPAPTVSVSAPSPPQPREISRHVEQLAPDDRDAFVHNLEIWRSLPMEERESLRREAGARVHAEVEKAIQESGLHLDPDRREVFALRYTQERRKIERTIQREAAAERARLLPEILARLKVEFGAASSPAPSPAATTAPTASPAP
jgi:hypothetical protein